MAMRETCIFTILVQFILVSSSIALANDQSYLARGSSISTGDDTTTILVSPNGAFTCGFYKVATNAFTVSIMRRKTNTMPNQDFSFKKLPAMDLWGYDLNYSEMVPWRMCRDMCLNSTDCQAFGYRRGTGECYPKVLLFNGKNFPDPYNDIYLKVPKAALSSPEFAAGLSHACHITEKEAYPSIPHCKCL
jgi:hypothetical protein